jgi:NADH-quinone oxidoreductase subunit L
MAPETLAWLVLLLPLGSAVLIALFLRRRGGLASALSVAAAAALAAGAGVLALRGGRFAAHVDWFSLGDFGFSFGILFDDLAALMLSVVAVVGLCVHVFSLAYMRDDAGRARYFGGLSIFMFSMVGIVLADNLFMMFVFWELVGFSSWLLINHWFERQTASDAAKKAFIVNRVGDVGFLLGIILCYWRYGTVNLGELGALAATGSVFTSRAIPLLLFCGAVGKSAQLPLQVWLPDAMEGPTPVSALIHAATMVAAGIYMLCRIQVLMVPDALTVILWVGTATALYAALCATVQSDIKKALAYSTLSQLGYMVAAFGLGSAVLTANGPIVAGAHSGVGAAMFHLTTHAFFKALLFLGSGSVILGCHHEQDIFKMGGLAGRMKFTFAAFTIGVAAISGFPFLSGFFSKDAILYLAFANNRAVFVVLAFTAALTAFYMTRLWRVVFLGRPRTDAAAHAHEGGWALTVPLGVLAALALVGGYTGIYGGAFSGILSLVPEAAGGDRAFLFATSVVALVLGAGTALLLYGGAAEAPAGPPDVFQRKEPFLFGALVWLRASFDRAYDYYVAKVQQRFALLLNSFDIIVLSGLIIRGAAGVAGLVGLGARALSVGRTNVYIYWLLAGVVLLWAFAARHSLP